MADAVLLVADLADPDAAAVLDGLRVNRDYVLSDEDVVELHI